MNRKLNLLVAILAFLPTLGFTQMITGVWKGKINRQKAEVKIILDGDSLRGTSYYYESSTRYRRYSIRGYFDPATNEAVWWDDQLIEEKPSLSAKGRMALLSRADFNCPGDGRMMLDGESGTGDQTPGELHLDKIDKGTFADEWDFVIDNFLVGGNDPYIIDSIGALAFNKVPPVIPSREKPGESKPEMVFIPAPAKVEEAPPLSKKPAPPKALTIQEKFESRKRILTTEIPVKGDSIELRFYDNAEIDGDSISLFLNNKLIYSNIRLTGSAFTVWLPVNELQENNELIMVAENLGSIPPNTSYMVAIVNEKRYEARLESNEGSSAMVRFVKTGDR